jgi:plastocyanin
MTKTQRRLFIGFLLLVVVAVCFDYAFSKLYNPSTLITIDETGFHPKLVTITEGTKIIFKNTGTEPHWPASNIHPSHEIYPEFDPKRELAPGETWEFVFDKPGVWRMHDHVFSTLTGTITVKSRSTTIASKNTPNSFVALRPITPLQPEGAKDIDLKKVDMVKSANSSTTLNFYLRVLGPKETMRELVTDSQGGSIRDCHAEAHNVGRAAFTMYGSGVFGIPDAASCHSGFYHGAMESFLIENGTENLAQNITALCQQFPTDFGIFECVHGVGHGVMAYMDYELPDALATCDTLSSTYDKNACYGGVFMENIVAGQGNGVEKDHETQWLSDDPHFPCNAIGSDYSKRYQCYQMQTSWMLRLYDYDFKRVGTECTKAPSDMVNVCFKSLGRDAAGNSLRDPAKILAICKNIPSTQYFDWCIEGGLNVIVDFWGGELKDQASNLCTLLPTDSKKKCFSTLAGRIGDITKSPEKKIEICNSFDIEYQSMCKK